MEKWEYLARIFPVGISTPEADIDIQSFLNENGQQGFRFREMQNYEAEFLIVMERKIEE